MPSLIVCFRLSWALALSSTSSTIFRLKIALQDISCSMRNIPVPRMCHQPAYFLTRRGVDVRGGNQVPDTYFFWHVSDTIVSESILPDGGSS